MKVVLLILLTMPSACAQSRDYWMKDGKRAVHEGMTRCPNVGVAKNVILFIGDGMGVSTITGARILKGQMDGGTGEEYRMEMEKFPYAGLIKTYNTDYMTADSAGCAVAFLSGVKTRGGVLGVDDRVVKGDCSLMPEANLDSIVDWALDQGKSVGIVTTTRITHATPAAGYAKTADRGWECDADMKEVTGCDGVQDIALQLVENYHNIQVVMGGGRNQFHTTTQGGYREDGRNLVKMWENKQKEKGVKYKSVKSNEELKAVPSGTEFLLGLFSDSHMSYEGHRNETGLNNQPSISAMFEKAHQILSKNDKGYFLLVEGGRIDHAHHANLAHLSLLDTIAMDKAVTSAVKLTSEKDTLIMVSADHSHVFTIGGYPSRDDNILGKLPAPNTEADGMPRTILMYANGPGPQRTNLTNQDTTDIDFVFPNGVPLSSETHGGEDVALFARGPMSHLAQGVQEQSVIAHIMARAACIGPYTSSCDNSVQINMCSKGSTLGTMLSGWIAVAFGLILVRELLK